MMEQVNIKRVVYISGPMRGIPEFNRQVFARAAQWWRGQGFAVINPVEIDAADELLGDPSMRATDKQIARDIDFIMKLRPGTDLVCSLPGWEKSEGATAEISLARWRQVTVEPFQPFQGPEPAPLKDKPLPVGPGSIRTFSTGATRDTDSGKLKYEGFFSPRVLKRRAEYMHKHRKQADGSLREPDNWQKGMEREVYMDSLLRHTVDAWALWREGRQSALTPVGEAELQDLLCAIMFNAEGMLFEILRGRDLGRRQDTAKEVRCE